MYDTILVPTDGSAGAAAAARHGAILAAAFDSEVHFLSVVDDRVYSSAIADSDPAVGAQRDALEEQATEAVEVLEAEAADSGVPSRTAVERGVPAEAIRSYAADHGVDLIAMGTHGRTGLDRVLLGSVTERVVRTSDVPVLTCRHEPADSAGYDRVLIPTDGSDVAAAAVEHGVAIAERYDATVHALSVVDTSSFASDYDAGAGLSGVIDALTADCERAVEAVEERCADRGVEVVTDVVQGTPYRTIRDYVEEEDVELVTMGTHGRTGLERLLLGSVTERVVRTSDVPVLTAR
jgi:nucleotide-binding universal stress UspA family protein